MQSMKSVLQRQSPNFNERNPDVLLQFVVLHYTGMENAQQAIERLCMPEAEVSAHYFIHEDGGILQLVAEDKRAWHAGKSFWRGITDINSASIGIELHNPGHQNGYRAFPAAQIKALAALAKEIGRRYQFGCTAFLGHSDVAPSRKEDPGELFPWQHLASEGIGVWPSCLPEDYRAMSDLNLQKALAAIGYNCPVSGDYERETRNALLAFQRHYHPSNLTGTPEAETVARLRAVLRAFNLQEVNDKFEGAA